MINLFIAGLNLMVAFYGLYTSIKHRRLGMLVWFLIAYFAVCFLPVAWVEQITHIQQYTNASFKVDQISLQFTLLFTLAFNCIFFVADFLFYWLHKSNLRNLDYYPASVQSNIIIACFIVCLLYGTVFYYLATQNFNYTDYVENVASWPMVFLWCAGSGICLAALRKNYLLALAMTVPFLYFMIHLKIRSFALLSVIPLIIILAIQFGGRSKSIFGNWRIFLFVLPLFAAVLLGANYAMNTKQTKARQTSIFPDSQMPFGSAIIIEGIHRQELSTGFNALVLYVGNLTNPFRRLLGIHTPQIVDPPTLMAQVYEGYYKEKKVKYHYPVLWYTDAVLAFGTAGLLLALFWAAVLNIFERIASYNATTLCIFLPAFCWHAYMLVRGATSGAAVPFLYSVYIAFLIFALVDFKAIFTKHDKKAPADLAIHSPILLFKTA